MDGETGKPLTEQKVEDYTSRKFLLALLAVGQVSVAFWLGKITNVEWMVFLALTFVGYGGLNVISDVLKKGK